MDLSIHIYRELFKIFLATLSLVSLGPENVFPVNQEGGVNPLALAADLTNPIVQSLTSASGGPIAMVAEVPVSATSVSNLTSTSTNAHRSTGSMLNVAAVDSQAQATATSPSYIHNDDPIIHLDYSSINDEVLSKMTANFVYFNANFNHCRHCHKFFQLWKELAVDIRWWRKVIKLFSINCSDEDNIDICRRAGVTQFPQVKYYWVMSNSLERDGQRLRILGKSVHAMRHLIMDKVLDSYMEHNRLLAQKAQQQQQKPSAPIVATNSNPALALLSSISSMGSSSSAAQNPLASLMGPILSHMTSVASPAEGSGSTGNGLGGLMSLLSSFTGGSTVGTGATTTLAPPKNPIASLGGLVSQLGGLQGVIQLLGNLIGGESSSKQRIVQALASNWPRLKPYEESNSMQLIDSLPLDSSKNLGALLILETQEFMYTGLEVMLDLSPYANQTYIYRIKDELSLLSRNLTKRDDLQAPTLIYVTPMKECRLVMTAPKYTNDEDLRRAFVRGFERRQIKYPVKRVWTTLASGANSVTTSDLSQEDEDLLGKTNQVHMNDLTNALRTSLMEQVYRHSDLSDDQYNALVKYTYALINYFPFNNEESLKFVKRLYSWLQNQVSLIDIGEYKKQFHDIDDHIPPREWIGCKSLSNTKSIPNKSKKSGGLLFENPAQFGKVVSNLTRLFRTQQQQVGKLKNLFSAFTSNMGVNAPVMLSNQGQGKGSYTNASGSTTAAPNSSSPKTLAPSGRHQQEQGEKKNESPIERLLRSLTSGSLGSDSSILKLISTALSGAGDGAGGEKSKFAREYPCGAWKLAHAMVVNEYIKDSPRKDVKHIVLHSLYQYMLHFYACPTCGNRVSDVSGEFRLNMNNHLQNQGDSVLLLWKMHNRVSRRLESEIRPGSPAKVQFPTESLCPKCRAPRAQSDFVSTPNWHDKQVLNFLVHHYRPQSLISASSDTSSSSSPSCKPSAAVGPMNLLVGYYCALLASTMLTLLFNLSRALIVVDVE